MKKVLAVSIILALAVSSLNFMVNFQKFNIANF
jgi:hypothetical protein